MNNYYIYAIEEFTDDWNIIYIGRTNDIHKRWNKHLYQERNWNLIQRFKENTKNNFRCTILYQGLSFKQAKEIETQLINQYKNLCNDDIGDNKSSQNKELLSFLKKRYWASPVSIKHREKLQQSSSGQQCKCIDTNEVFSSITEAAKIYKVSYSTIYNACSSRRKACGYLWEFIDRDKIEEQYNICLLYNDNQLLYIGCIKQLKNYKITLSKLAGSCRFWNEIQSLPLKVCIYKTFALNDKDKAIDIANNLITKLKPVYNKRKLRKGK